MVFMTLRGYTRTNLIWVIIFALLVGALAAMIVALSIPTISLEALGLIVVLVAIPFLLMLVAGLSALRDMYLEKVPAIAELYADGNVDLVEHLAVEKLIKRFDQDGRRKVGVPICAEERRIILLLEGKRVLVVMT